MEEILLSREGIKEQPHTQRGAGLLLFFFVALFFPPRSILDKV
jgi:hypothetical protein